MTDRISSFNLWLSTPLGQYLKGWEEPCLNHAVEDVFGYNALQLGQAHLHSLANSRIPNRWLVLEDAPKAPIDEAALKPSLITRFDALPFADQSIDLVILPHTLDLSADPHATLREVARVLVPEGKVIITGITPTSLWGLRQRRVNFMRRLGANSQFIPLDQGTLLGYWRIRDWLRLLNLELCAGSFGCYRPAFKTQKWLDRAAWMEKAGDRWWPILGATYQITAVKRIKGMRLIDPGWKRAPIKQKARAVASSSRTNKTKQTTK